MYLEINLLQKDKAFFMVHQFATINEILGFAGVDKGCCVGVFVVSLVVEKSRVARGY